MIFVLIECGVFSVDFPDLICFSIYLNNYQLFDWHSFAIALDRFVFKHECTANIHIHASFNNFNRIWSKGDCSNCIIPIDSNVRATYSVLIEHIHMVWPEENIHAHKYIQLKKFRAIKIELPVEKKIKNLNCECKSQQIDYSHCCCRLKHIFDISQLMNNYFCSFSVSLKSRYSDRVCLKS